MEKSLRKKFLRSVGCLAVAYFVGVAAGQSLAADGENADLAAQVRNLVSKFNSEEKQVREEAEVELLKLGPNILPLLKPYLDDPGTTDAARQFLRNIQRTLQLDRAKAEGEAKTVTLSGDALPLSEILAAFTQQTGNKIVDLRPQFGQAVEDPKLKVSFSKTPFWQALDRVLDDAKLKVYPFSNKDGIGIVAQGEGDTPRLKRATYSGPFRFEATKLIAERDLRNPEQRSLKLAFEVAWEPRLSPVSIRQALDQLQAVDDQGRSLAVDAKGARDVLLSNTATAVNLDAPLVLPPRDAKKIASLKGSVSVVVLGGVEEFSFDKLTQTKDKTLKQGDVSVVFRKTIKNNDLWQVELQVKLSSSAKGIESHTNWIARNEAVLIGPDKKPILPATTESQQEEDNAQGMVYLFDGPKTLEGYTFVLKSPTAARELPIDFELKDLELP